MRDESYITKSSASIPPVAGTAVARYVSMKLTMRALGYGLGCGVGIGALTAAIKYWRKRREMSPEDLPVGGQFVDTDLRDVAMHSGIADVDPQNLSHVAGEGIDLDLDTAAHDVLVEVRERMPR